MKRIDTANKSTDLFGTGKHGFRDRDPGVNGGTIGDSTWLNGVQEEIARAVEGAGCIVDGSANNQLVGILQMGELHKALTVTPFTTPGSADLNDVAGDVGDDADNICVAVGAGGAIYRLGNSDIFESDTAGSGFAGDFLGVCAAGATYGHVAVGASEEIQTGTAGTWTRRNTGGSDDLSDVDFDPTNDRVVAIGTGATIWRGTDISTWTDQTANSALAGNLNRVRWVDSLSLWVIWGAGGVQTSPDGVTWTQRSALNFDSGEWIESLGLAVGFVNGSADVYYSTDLVTWTDSGANRGTFGPVAGARIMVCEGGLLYPFQGNPSSYGIRFAADGRPSANSSVFRAAPQDDVGYQANEHDPLLSGYWICGVGGVVGFAPMPYGI